MDISPQPMLATSIKETNVAQKNETSSIVFKYSMGGFARGAASWAQYSEQLVEHNTQYLIHGVT